MKDETKQLLRTIRDNADKMLREAEEIPNIGIRIITNKDCLENSLHPRIHDLKIYIPGYLTMWSSNMNKHVEKEIENRLHFKLSDVESWTIFFNIK